MSVLQHTILIDAPLTKVWGVLNNLEEIGNYNPIVKSVIYTSENKHGVGSSRHCVFTHKGFAKERVTNIDEGKSITMEMYESDWPLRHMFWTNHLREINGKTEMTTITDFKMSYGLFGIAMERLIIKKKFDKILVDMFQSFKTYIESKN